MKKSLSALLACAFTLIFSASLAQKHTLNGYITDANTGEILIGAVVYVPALSQGSVANAYGFYSITLPEGEHQITVSFVGYKPSVLTQTLTSDTKIDFKLETNTTLQEFEIIAEATEAIAERTQMSTIEVSMEQIKNIPALLGERDVLKAIQLLPGVQSGAEGTSGFYVRGGGPDQNLILLDGVPVYNASHLFGFFSVFNPDAINNVQLIKGGFPARYGGRLSSVLDIRMKEGNSEEFKGEGSIGLVASKLTLEGPIGDKTTFIVSGRRTYIDMLARPIIRSQARNEGVELDAGYYFYDLNAKINHRLNTKNRLYLSLYTGRDKAYTFLEESTSASDFGVPSNTTFTSELDAELGWGNITGALRWNSELNKKLFMNLTATYSKYEFEIGQRFKDTRTTNGRDTSSEFKYDYFSGITDYAVKADFDFYPNPNHLVRFGAGNIFHTFSPGVNTFTNQDEFIGSLDTTIGNADVNASEYSVYVEDDWRINARLKLNAGLHFSGFLVGSTHYPSIQPRISGRYFITDNLSAKASFATMRQFIHLLSNAGIGLPTDLWVPATQRVKPQESWQVAAGLAQNLPHGFEASIELYYKHMANLIEYKDGASFLVSSGDWQDQIEVGDGESYGAEFFVQKKVGKTTGWIGYTLSWTTRQFDNLNFGEPFFYRYDRRHDMSIVLTHKFNERIDIGATWVYGTGNAVTLPTSKYLSLSGGSLGNIGGFFTNYVEYIPERNGFRTPSYHRLDLGVNIHKQKKYWNRTWSFGLYNAYSRRNPFYIYVAENFNTQRSELRQVALFPVIPYFSYSFKF